MILGEQERDAVSAQQAVEVVAPAAPPVTGRALLNDALAPGILGDRRDFLVKPALKISAFELPLEIFRIQESKVSAGAICQDHVGLQ